MSAAPGVTLSATLIAYRRLLALTVLLAVVVIGLGAYVRLSDAGLGCPDWPGCYGQLLGVPKNAADPGRAAKEMAHRYLAGSLGLAILGLAILAWRLRAQLSPTLPGLLLGLIVGQALLGKWTVSERLQPLVVSAHLLGGMATLALQLWLYWRQSPVALPAAPPGLRRWAILALGALCLQIALGGWVSSNYAALACSGFPSCGGQWWPSMDFSAAFELQRPLGESANGQALSLAALTAIHWAHRLGAVALVLIGGALALRLARLAGWRSWGWLLGLALLAQFGLGIANVLLARPLPLAVAHNLGAALLLVIVVTLAARPAAEFRKPVPAL